MPWQYFIDADGDLWHEGALIDDPAVLKLFMQKMEKIKDRLYRVFCQGEECLITAEDVPFVVKRLRLLPNEKAEFPQAVELIFAGDVAEPLDPSTLFVGKLNVLYCKIRDGKFTARFNRTTYLDLTKKIKFNFKTKSFYLTVDNQKYTIKGVA